MDRAHGNSRAEIDKILHGRYIDVQSTRASQIVFRPKYNCLVRFCIDYRKLNALIVKEACPIPRKDEKLDSLGVERIFSKLDAIFCVLANRIPRLRQGQDGLYISPRTVHIFMNAVQPENAPSTFQRAIDFILSTVKWWFALVYLHDVFIFLRSVKEHLNHLQTVLELLSRARVSLELKKCFFLEGDIDCCVQVTRPGRLDILTRVRDAIRRLQHPNNVTALKTFLGLCKVFRQFVRIFARIPAILNCTFEKDQQYTLDSRTKLKLRRWKPYSIAICHL